MSNTPALETLIRFLEEKESEVKEMTAFIAKAHGISEEALKNLYNEHLNGE